MRSILRKRCVFSFISKLVVVDHRCALFLIHYYFKTMVIWRPRKLVRLILTWGRFCLGHGRHIKIEGPTTSFGSHKAMCLISTCLFFLMKNVSLGICGLVQMIIWYWGSEIYLIWLKFMKPFSVNVFERFDWTMVIGTLSFHC